MKEKTEQKLKSFEVLGVENLTDAETSEMAHITANLLFKVGYRKSDAIIDLLKMFKVKDTKANRRFALAAMTFGAAAESANRKLGQLLDCVKGD